MSPVRCGSTNSPERQRPYLSQSGDGHPLASMASRIVLATEDALSSSMKSGSKATTIFVPPVSPANSTLNIWCPEPEQPTDRLPATKSAEAPNEQAQGPVSPRSAAQPDNKSRI